MSFQLEVEFSGLCMYVIHPDARQIAVLLPDATFKGLPPLLGSGPDPMALVDGSIGKAHVGYLRYDLADTGADVPRLEKTPEDADEPPPLFEVIHRFKLEELDFGLGFDEPLESKSAATALDPQPDLHVPHVARFAPDLRLREGMFDHKPENLLMRTILRGGSLDSEQQTGKWQLDQTLNKTPAAYVDQFSGAILWTRRVHAEELVLRLSAFDGSEKAVIRLRPKGQKRKIRLRVANLCSDNPVEWPELMIRDFAGKFDEDFRWFYNLLDIKSADLATLKTKTLPLPSPELIIPPVANPAFGGGTGEADCTGSKLVQGF